MNPDAAKTGEEAAREQAPVKQGEVLMGKYVIGPRLGVGGMGVVVEGYDERLERRVAIKFLLPRLVWSDTSVQRFVQEARTATRVTSEHVVKLLEIDKLPSGVPFFVMEYLSGQDLKSLLSSQGPPPVQQAVDFVLQALQAVAEGHVKDVVHRDLKPGNLFLTQRADGTPLIKVLDFGIAKTLHSEQAEHSTSITNTGDMLLGSPSYMSPEQLLSPRDVDARSDIWSLGVTLYELLSGRLPFEGASHFALMTNIMNASGAELKAPAAHDLPDGLAQVVGRCLQKKREARFADAIELARALAPFGSDDARISLKRIVGLASPAPSLLSRPSLNGIESLRATTTTLPLPSAPLAAGQVARRRARLGSWVVIACALLALGLGASTLATRESATLPKQAVKPAAAPAALASGHPTAASAAAAAAVSVARDLRREPVPPSPPPTSAGTLRSATGAALRLEVRSDQKGSVSRANAVPPAPSAAGSSSAPAARPASAAARRIEELIQDRH